MNEEIILHSTTMDDLKQIICEAVKEEIRRSLPAIPTEPTEFLTRKEVCELLHVSSVTLNIWTKKGIVNGYKFNSRIRYRRSEIEAVTNQIKPTLNNQ